MMTEKPTLEVQVSKIDETYQLMFDDGHGRKLEPHDSLDSLADNIVFLEQDYRLRITYRGLTIDEGEKVKQYVERYVADNDEED